MSWKTNPVAVAALADTSVADSIGVSTQAQSAQLDEIAALDLTDGNFIVTNGTAFVAESGGAVRTSLGLGSIATEAASAFIKADGTTTVTADLNMNSHKIINVTSPTNDGDAASKLYVDTIATGLDFKQSSRAATISSAELSGFTYTGGGTDEWSSVSSPVIDGVTLSDGDRLLIKDATNQQGNGIWTYDSGASKFIRAEDADNSPENEVSNGLFTFVEEGTLAGTGWILTSPTGQAVLGTDNLVFTQFSSASDILAGDNLTKTGNTIDLDPVLVDFASTGIDDNAVSTAITIDSSQNVKFGGATTITPSTGSDDFVIDKGASESGMSIISTTNGWIDFGDAGSATIGRIRYAHSTDTMHFKAGGTDVLLATSGGIGIVGDIDVGSTTQHTAFTGSVVGHINIDAPSNTGDYADLTFEGSGGNPAAKIAYRQTAAGGELHLGTSNNYGSGITIDAIVIDPTGSIGVKTATPDTTLDVSGAIRATGSQSPTTGTGLELEYLGSTGYVTVIDRATTTWKDLNLRGATIAMSPSGATKATVSSTGIAITNGNLYLSNAQNVRGRNVGDTEDYDLIGVNNANQVEIGDASHSIQAICSSMTVNAGADLAITDGHIIATRSDGAFAGRFINTHATAPNGIYVDFSGGDGDSADSVFRFDDASTIAKVEITGEGDITLRGPTSTLHSRPTGTGSIFDDMLSANMNSLENRALYIGKDNTTDLCVELKYVHNTTASSRYGTVGMFGLLQIKMKQDGETVFPAGNVSIPSGNLSIAGKLNIGAEAQVTIASGAIAHTSTRTVVDTQGAAASDDLDTISGGVDGDVIILRQANNSRDVTFKDGTGNLALAGDFTPGDISGLLTLVYTSTNAVWFELSRSSN